MRSMCSKILLTLLLAGLCLSLASIPPENRPTSSGGAPASRKTSSSSRKTPSSGPGKKTGQLSSASGKPHQTSHSKSRVEEAVSDEPISISKRSTASKATGSRSREPLEKSSDSSSPKEQYPTLTKIDKGATDTGVSKAKSPASKPSQGKERDGPSSQLQRKASAADPTQTASKQPAVRSAANRTRSNTSSSSNTKSTAPKISAMRSTTNRTRTTSSSFPAKSSVPPPSKSTTPPPQNKNEGANNRPTHLAESTKLNAKKETESESQNRTSISVDTETSPMSKPLSSQNQANTYVAPAENKNSAIAVKQKSPKPLGSDTSKESRSVKPKLSSSLSDSDDQDVPISQRIAKRRTESGTFKRKSETPRPSQKPSSVNTEASKSSAPIAKKQKKHVDMEDLDISLSEDTEEEDTIQVSQKRKLSKSTDDDYADWSSDQKWRGPTPRGKSSVATGPPYALDQQTSSLGGRLSGKLQRAKDQGFAAIREIKGIISSELEAVLLKATRPTDFPVKPKHLEALLYCVRTTPPQYDVYTPILKKLWAKMCEGDWRTTAKATYILHMFSVQGMEHHASLLKSRPKEMSRQYSPKYKNNYFNLKQLPLHPSGQDVAYMDYTRRYLEYVMTRTKSFSPKFVELTEKDMKDKWIGLDANHDLISEIKVLTKSAFKLLPKRDEQSKITLSCAERVAADIEELYTTINSQIMKELDDVSSKTNSDNQELQQWIDFYTESGPRAESFLKKVSTLVANEGGEALFKTKLPIVPPAIV